MSGYQKKSPTVRVKPLAEKTSKSQRIGIYLGKFDPVHTAHLLVAEQVRAKLNLSEIWFIPQGKGQVNLQKRVLMLGLATTDNSSFKVNVFNELQGPEVNLLEFLTDLNRRWPGKEFFLLLGSDEVANLQSQKLLASLTNLTTLVGIPRANYSVKTSCPIIWVDVPQFAISSAEIRQSLKSGLSVRYLVPSLVSQYLEKEGLYR